MGQRRQSADAIEEDETSTDWCLFRGGGFRGCGSSEIVSGCDSEESKAHGS